VATPPNAIILGSGHVEQRDMIRAGFRLVVISVILISLFGWFVWR
jgi:sodium-dependent dicarboxylate transporter 2/3/5